MAARPPCILTIVILVVHQLSLVSGKHYNFLYSNSAQDVTEDRRSSAVDIGIDTIAAQGKLPLNFSYSLYVVPWGCEPSNSISDILDHIIRYDIDVVFGSICSTVTIPLTYVLQRWNIPIFPEASTSPVLNDKVKYPNVIRVNAEYGKMGKAFVKIFGNYGWNRAIIFNLDSGICDYGAKGINNNLKESGIVVAEWIRHVSTSIPDEEITGFLERIKQRGRIVIMCHYRADVIRVLMRAQELGMDNGEYVFFYYGLVPDGEFFTKPWNTKLTDYTPEQIKERISIFRSYKQVTMASLSGPKIDNFLRNVSDRLQYAPYYTNFTWATTQRGSIYSTFLHDATVLYLDILNETLSEGLNPKNGTVYFEKAKNRSFEGITGTVLLDDNADRDPNYWLWYFGPDVEEMTPWLEVAMSNPVGQRMTLLRTPYWATPDGKAPPDVPVCGLQYELCPPNTKVRDTIIGTVVTFVLAITFFGLGLALYQKKKKMETELNQMLWKIGYDDIDVAKKRASSITALSAKSLKSLESGNLSANSHAVTWIDVGYYKGILVAIRHVKKDSVELTRVDLLELKELREMSHENINPFVGACIDSPNICILTQYCPKGSLQDILENDDIKLDWMFKSSLISDLTNGMEYLHTTSNIGSHGKLKSTNCLIDNRWSLRITSYGLYAFKHGEQKEEIGEYETYKSKLWTSPELLRMGIMAPRYGTKKGDVFSFAIILQEILYRAMPYFVEIMTPKEVVDEIMEAKAGPYRPELPKQTDASDEVLQCSDLMRECWAESPDDRPSFEGVKKRLRRINKGRKVNIMDTMLAKLEKYASNLEEIVQQRTSELVDEKRKTDQLLFRMLPAVVAEELKQGRSVNPELYDEVTIYFSDVVGFTSLSSESTPMQVVDLLNDLYTLFDDIIAQHDVYKVETIGDAYMCVSGLPQRNGDRHAAEIANMALDLLSAVYTQFRVRHRPELQMKLRIGMHTGPCAAGVVGLTMPRYCLFGDTVNMASRMESNGLPLRIHLSEEAHSALNKFEPFKMKDRGQIEVKGKGLVETYWLYGKTGYENSLPALD